MAGEGELSQGKNYNRKEGLFNCWWCFLKVEIYLLWASGNIFIVLLPILFGIGYAALYTYLFCGTAWNESTLSIALTSTTLSLSIYAITEKFFEKKKNGTASEESERLKVSENSVSDKPVQTKHFIVKR